MPDSVAGPLLPTKFIFFDGTPPSEHPTILPYLVERSIKWLCLGDPSKLICFLPAFSDYRRDEISHNAEPPTQKFATYDEMRSSAMGLLEKLQIVVKHDVAGPLAFTVTGSRDSNPCLAFTSSSLDVLVAAKTEAEVHHALLAIVVATFREWAGVWHVSA
jgi:hypothetical protein